MTDLKTLCFAGSYPDLSDNAQIAKAFRDEVMLPSVSEAIAHDPSVLMAFGKMAIDEHALNTPEGRARFNRWVDKYQPKGVAKVAPQSERTDARLTKSAAYTHLIRNPALDHVAKADDGPLDEVEAVDRYLSTAEGQRAYETYLEAADDEDVTDEVNKAAAEDPIVKAATAAFPDEAQPEAVAKFLATPEGERTYAAHRDA